MTSASSRTSIHQFDTDGLDVDGERGRAGIVIDGRHKDANWMGIA